MTDNSKLIERLCDALGIKYKRDGDPPVTYSFGDSYNLYATNSRRFIFLYLMDMITDMHVPEPKIVEACKIYIDDTTPNWCDCGDKATLCESCAMEKYGGDGK